MRYISTRGGMAPATFSDILLGGLAPDGGLALPETYPTVTPAELAGWRGLSYPELAFCLLYTSPSPRDATLSRMPSSA